MLFFFEIMQILVEKANRCYPQYMDTRELRQSLPPDETVQEMCLFLEVIAHKGQHHTDSFEDYRSKL